MTKKRKASTTPTKPAKIIQLETSQPTSKQGRNKRQTIKIPHLHALLFFRPGKLHDKACAMLSTHARCKASKCQPASKHGAGQATNHESPQALHPLLFSWTGKQQDKASAKLVASRRQSMAATSNKLPGSQSTACPAVCSDPETSRQS